MSIRDLVPRGIKRRTPVRRLEDNDLFSFHREMNRLFDEFFSDAGLLPSGGADREGSGRFSPRVNVAETDTGLKVVAELPGMDEKDVTVEVDDQSITLRGERKEEHEDKQENWYRVEHTYGSFQRVIPLPAEVNGAKAEASFKKGVLTVTLPKRAEVEGKKKRIAITAG
ncbi:MAG: Hsp20/alpha crystallin family protein [Lentisphaerae bacterium]|nr:Hsp20/alpha crystallin family protein [Lentisphaerota bacterium]